MKIGTMKKYIITLLLLLCISSGIHAQLVVSDVVHTKVQFGVAGSTAATVKQVVEGVNRLQQTLDLVQKVNSYVKTVVYLKELIQRQERINKQCIYAFQDLKALQLDRMQNLSASIENVILGNVEIINFTVQVLSPVLKMTDSQRIKQLLRCREKLMENEAQLQLVRQIIYNTQDIQACLK